MWLEWVNFCCCVSIFCVGGEFKVRVWVIWIVGVVGLVVVFFDVCEFVCFIWWIWDLSWVWVWIYWVFDCFICNFVCGVCFCIRISMIKIILYRIKCMGVIVCRN